MWIAALIAVAAHHGAADHVDIQAALRRGASGAEIAVTLTPRDHDIKVNRAPSPRLTLDAAQQVLSLKPAKVEKGEKKEGYLDTTFPVVFPVEVGAHGHGGAFVKGTLTYYYCSKAEGWCRKGTREVEVPANLP
jgi:hypothetical protein